ncbi:MAG: zinc ribbon domain-containing protein [Clostridiales bacterium]|jgi:RNA polymerase subunit RPABC4/transcription elongation factor Spt4|nr:zinc ribbon domain-containing protein [Clostridiales bacterium]
MATYREPCIHCGEYIGRDSHFCPSCGSQSPFSLRCPACRKVIKKGDLVCSGCGRSLYASCPSCGSKTFVGERCERCKADLMVRCSNERCGRLQFFENVKCTECGKKLRIR